MKLIFRLLAITQLLLSAEAAIIVAEHTLPSNATSWFDVGAGIGTDDGRVFDNRQAQTFVPTASGFLQDVSFNVYRISTTADLRVSITEVLGGQPGTTLDSALLPVSTVGTTPLSSSFLLSGAFSHSVTMSGSLLLEAGVSYAVVFSSDTTEANYRIYGDRSGYSEGSNLRFQNSGPYVDAGGSDLLFRVTATPIPEPKATFLFGLAGLVLWAQRIQQGRRRRAASDLIVSRTTHAIAGMSSQRKCGCVNGKFF
jgi:hypothetical protein